MKEFVINGPAESGKDTFIKLFAEKYGNNPHTVFNYSSIDPFRGVPYNFGWDGEKSEDYRSCLHYLKKAASFIDNYPIRHLHEMRNQHSKDTDVIFYHIREPEEIEKFIDSLEFPPTTILVTRNSDYIPDNPGDRKVWDFSYDYIVENTGSLEELEASVDVIYKECFGG